MSNDQKNKNTVITLLSQGELTGREIAQRTGFVPSRVSQIKKEWEQNGKHLPTPAEPERTHPDTSTSRVQSENLPATVEVPNWVESQLQEAMIQCIENLKQGIPTDQTTIDCIILIATLMKELYYAPLPTQPSGFRGSEEPNDEQDTGSAVGNRISFMERVAKLSSGAGNNG